jgi:DNA-binding NtrC family response regulator
MASLMIAPAKANLGPNISALMISASEPDFEALYTMFHNLNWKLQAAHNCRQAFSALNRSEFPVILCEGRLPDGNWRTVRAYLPGGPAQLIVTSRIADEQQWTGALDSGCYDVLMTPFRREEALRVITGAWLQWRIESAANWRYQHLRA